MSESDEQMNLNRELYIAVIDNKPVEVEKLLRKGADPNCCLEYDDVCPFYPMEQYKIELIYKKFGRAFSIPLLFLAVGFELLEIAELLIKYKANVNNFCQYIGSLREYSEKTSKAYEFSILFQDKKEKRTMR